MVWIGGDRETAQGSEGEEDGVAAGTIAAIGGDVGIISSGGKEGGEGNVECVGTVDNARSWSEARGTILYGVGSGMADAPSQGGGGGGTGSEGDMLRGNAFCDDIDHKVVHKLIGKGGTN